MNTTGIGRVQYFQKQFLRARDFTDEQAYHVAMRRRHYIAHHTWGIVRGLDIVVDPDGSLFVQSGFAIDGYGRELILSARRQVGPKEFSDKGSVLDIFLVYARQTSDPAPGGYAGCNGASGGAYRAAEVPMVRFEKPDLSYPNRRQPKGVPQADYNFDATRSPVDAPSSPWPVFLGQVTRSGTDAQPTYVVNPADRPYAGLVGEAVIAPSGAARLQIGKPQDSTKKNQFTGFGVFVPPSADLAALEIDTGGGISLRGDSQLYGNLTINNGALEFVVGTAAAPPPVPVQPNQAAQPWKIYLDSSARELRIEMAAGAGDGSNSVAIGAFDNDKKQFMPCFTVDDQCNVTVEGDLIVNGQIRGSAPNSCPDLVSTGLTKEARDFVLSGLLGGIGSSSVLLERFFRNPAPVPTAQTIVNALAADPTLLNHVAADLRANYAQAADTFRNLL